MQILTQIRRGNCRPIEGFTLYTILDDGTVVNIYRARVVQPTSNGHRLSIQLTNDAGRRVGLGLARLILSHFVPMPDDGQYYDAVHKDGNVMNVHPSNLAWVARWKRHANQDNYEVDIS